MDKGAAKMNGTSQATGAMNGTSPGNAGGVANSGDAATGSRTVAGAKLPRIPTAPRGNKPTAVSKQAAASKQSVTAQSTRLKAPPPPSSRRELPAPTPLVLPSRLQGAGSSTASRSQKPSPASTSVAKSQSAARQTLALKKAPPPPSSRRNQAGSGAVPSTAAPKPKQSHERSRHGSARVESGPTKNSHDIARQADAQWAAHLDQPREPGRVTDYRVPEEPPQLPDNLPLLNLEGEISALRPRPSEIPPEPARLEDSEADRHAHQDVEPEGLASAQRAQGAYRRKTPSDLSLLYQAMPSPDRNVGLSSVRATNSPRSRGYVPKAPHEFLPPPPPPNKRGAAKSFSGEEDDEAPTQARRPALHPYEVTPPPPEVVMPTSRRDSTPVPGPASMIVPAQSRAQGRPVSPIPPPTAMIGAGRLPAPPPLPTGLHAETTWEDREWTDSRHLEAIQLEAVSPVPVVNPTPAPTVYEARPAPMSHGATDSVRPTSLTVPAPAHTRFPTFGLPAGWVPVAGASVLGAAISAGAFILPDRGQLLVDVSNQSWTSLRDAQVYVNDELVCTQSPCAVKVDAAPQRVRVTAPGYQSSGEDSVIVSEGSVTLHKVQLGASADTGIEVQTSVPNLQLYVDGRRIGSLPRKVMGLPPGEHTLVVSGGDSFTTEERRIQLEPNQTLVIDDLQPKLKSGTLELRAGENAAGARVTLDGAQISLPFTGTLEPGRRYAVRAERDGFVPFEQSVQVDPASPVLNVALDLSPLGSAEAPETQTADPASRWNRSRWRWQASQQSKPDTEASDVTPRANTQANEAAPTHDGGSLGDSPLGAAMRQSVGLPPAEKTEKAEAKAVGSGSINIVTSPSAIILLDGKPVGKTPKRLTVSAGKHSLVLIHPNGRKRASISVEPGANKTIKASF